MGESIIKKVASRIRVGDGMCPKGHSLMTGKRYFDGERAIVAHVRHAGHAGIIFLNPYYGRFEYECDLTLNKGDIVELFCPKCGQSLSIDIQCRLCNIQMFAVQLPDGGQVEACPKIGCHNHSLKIVDLDTQLERMYVNETKIQM